MKKILVIALAIVMALTCLSVIACAKTTVRVILHDANDSPRVVNHTYGEDDLSAIAGENQAFKGWYYDKEFNQPFAITDEVADGTHLYAEFEDLIVKVSLTLNFNHDGANDQVVVLDKDSAYDLPTPNRANYNFAGWWTGRTDGTQWTNTTPVSEDTTLYAHWTEIPQPTEKVILNLNPNYAGAVLTTERLDKGSTYSLPTLTLSGYTFNGWYTQPTGGVQWTSSTPVNEDTTLYAHWTATSQPVEKVILNLNPNYAGATLTTERIDKGSTYSLPNLTLSGYTFEGWYTQPTGGVKWTSSTPVNADTTLYAHWTENSQPVDQVTLTLNLNYTGAAAPTTVTISKGSTYSLTTPTRSGYTFDGWYNQATGGTKYTSSTAINADTTLYAHWTENSQPVDQVTLTLNLNYTGAAAPTTVTINKGSTYSLTTPTRSGYTFDGWYNQATGGTKYTSSTPINADTVLYAHWTQNSQGSTDSVKEQFLNSVVSQPQDGASYYIAMYYALPDKVYYGVNSLSGKKLTSTENKSEATVATIEKTTNGFYIKLNNQYLSLSASDTVSLTSSASTVFSIGENNILIATYSGKEYTLGSYYNGSSTTLYTHFGVSAASYSTGTNASKVDVSQFPARLVTLDGLSAPVYPMDDQVYDPDTFDNQNLQDKMSSEDYIGLPSIGTYRALVIPVQFVGDTITQTQLNNLNIAFNGTSEQTGWESVKTYYQKSSYGKLNLTFDIQDVFHASNNSAYYKDYNGSYTVDGQSYQKDGSMLILEEALAYYESRLDLTDYDYNKDGCIDAVYLIYSASVDYDDADFYWAYVTWYGDEKAYDGLYPYYYLFAGFDFMDEKVPGKDTQGYTTISGLKINAETYIHETGHLLGLDDYYDYDEESGSNQGLGGADMMDYNVGDHGVYSKIMLGWLTPEIVTSTKTVTIQSSQDGGYAILIPLNWNNSYFCEYLLIDLYTNTGLNAMSASQTNSILYDGASYGVRIYHVSSSINNPYSDQYGSFTDNNNSMSGIPLIKLVEADGETSKSTEGSWASASDLWQTGDSLNSVFPSYTRNDGMSLNFNITIDSVSAESATVIITYNPTAA